MFQGNSQKELYRVKVEDCRQDHMVNRLGHNFCHTEAGLYHFSVTLQEETPVRGGRTGWQDF